MGERERRQYINTLAVNLVLNAGWSWLFFNRRLLGTSAIAAAVLAVSSSDLNRRAVRRPGQSRRSALSVRDVVYLRHRVVQPCLAT